MIPRLLTVVGHSFRPRIQMLMAGLALEGALMGLGFVALVPFLRAVLDGDADAAVLPLIGLAVVFLAYAVTRWVMQLYGYRTGLQIANVLFERLGAQIKALPLGWFNERRAGELSVMSSEGIVEIMSLAAHLMRPLVVAITAPAIVLIFIAFIDWQLAVALGCVIPFAVAAFIWSGSHMHKADHSVHGTSVDAAARIYEFAQAQTVLRAFGRTDGAARELDRALVQSHDATMFKLRNAASGFLAFTLTIQLALTVLLVYGVNRSLGGEVDVPELVAIFVLGIRFAEPLLGAADVQDVVRSSDATLGRMQDILDLPLMQSTGNAKPQDNAIRFDNVTFGYNDQPVLDGFTLDVPANSLVAVVGPSGAGKSTVLRLIARFFDVEAGRVSVGGADVRDIATETLMDQLAVVFQDVYLFDGTIADNILISKPDASRDALWDAVRAAQLEATLARFPAGLDTPVGEGGAALSGGEKQRVSIARALLKNANIVLLDEATAALDALDEARMRASIEKLAQDRTVIAISHRLSTIQAADKIVFLEDGKVAEEGDHATLLARGGRYAAFCALMDAKLQSTGTVEPSR
ncbi:ABC transporter ATP-binding protein [Tateyamaria sp. syn59]|uniref:ABC transporter ATP-binding protein n=1 Tax=Tateyamaria sp. syn59 TaxID=2576942 RepID=UPI0011BE074E|nr:ABC transporter ATP-binding protein [Tateyamaria sp. syn59]